MKISATIANALLLAVMAGGSPLSAAAVANAEPKSAREFFNAGTRALGGKHFPAAEKWLASALATQDEKIQPRALYNLGQVWFEDGLDALKKGPSATAAVERGKTAAALAGRMLSSGQTALTENDLKKMIAAYQAGQGLRKELTAAREAVWKAMEVYGGTLRKWRLAADDFRSAAELNPADTNAQRNAEIVGQHIAKLVDSLREMQEMAGQLAGRRQQLKNMLSELKGRIPKENAPPGAEGDEADEPDMGSMQGQMEPPPKDGSEMETGVSPEMAGQLLDSLAPSGTRRLPMADQKTSQSKEKKSRTW
ncbi:MAG: hypothetical protein WCH99_16830 [Verrucomicrobiota bacterium]